MKKLDLKKDLKHLYKPSSKEVSVVEVPPFNYLKIDGKGSPDGKEAMDAIQTLYPIAYKLKFMSKTQNKDFTVMPLEGLWWADDMNAFTEGKRDDWKWTYMILQPEFITKKDVEEAIEEVKNKKELVSIDKVRFEEYKEGKAAQIMHIGPYSEEGPNIQKLHDHIKELGGKFDGKKQKHHEIYLSDPRRGDPSKTKTVIRQPFISSTY